VATVPQTPVAGPENPSRPFVPPPPPPRTPAFAVPGSLKPGGDDLEGRIGKLWLNRIGAVAILTGVAYFIKYAFDSQMIGPAGRIAIVEGLPQCQPVLLEPIHVVEIVCPTDATARINAILSGRRGQILGFDTREGWPGWDRVRAMMPEAEIGELIVELRSATAGAGSFTRQFDRMAEVTGRAADQIIAAHRVAA